MYYVYMWLGGYKPDTGRKLINDQPCRGTEDAHFISVEQERNVLQLGEKTPVLLILPTIVHITELIRIADTLKSSLEVLPNSGIRNIQTELICG